MGSGYDADRIFGILTRLRACVGLALGVVVMMVCGAAGAVRPPVTPPDRALAQSNRATLPPELRATLDAQRGTYSRETQARTAFQGVLVFTATIMIAISAFEFAIGKWIGDGDRAGFFWGAIAEGLSCLIGLFNLGTSPLAIIGFLLSLATFVYCLARLNGTGPKPV